MRLVLGLPGAEALARSISDASAGGAAPWRAAPLEHRRFPDGELYLRATEELAGADVALVACLSPPNGRLTEALLAGAMARDLGARRVGLIAGYLPYLRQDVRFRMGEAVSSRYVADTISRSFDWLITVDPHLHRIASLAELFSVPARVVSSADAVAGWIARNVDAPLLVGPDEESAQWVTPVASRLGAPYLILDKVRRGDREVAVRLLEVPDARGRKAVLIDDIISTGETVRAAVAALRDAGLSASICVCVHPVFASGAAAALAGAEQVASVNTLPHASNAIDIGPAIAAELGALGE